MAVYTYYSHLYENFIDFYSVTKLAERELVVNLFGASVKLDIGNPMKSQGCFSEQNCGIRTRKAQFKE